MSTIGELLSNSPYSGGDFDSANDGLELWDDSEPSGDRSKGLTVNQLFRNFDPAVLADEANTFTEPQTIDTGVQEAPFSLGADQRGEKVVGLNADMIEGQEPDEIGDLQGMVLTDSSSSSGAGTANRTERAQAVQDAIDKAVNDGKPYVLVLDKHSPKNGGYDASAVTFNHSVLLVHEQSRKLFNVRAYGAAGDGTIDDTPAAQAATDAAENRGSGVLWFPDGAEYPIGTITPSTSGICLLGESWSAIIRAPGVNNGAFYWNNVAEDVFVRNLSLDVNSSDDFDGVIKFETSSGPVLVENCRVFDSNKAGQGNWTINAIISQGVDDVTVRFCEGDGVQFKLAGGSGLSHDNITAVGNYLFEPSAYGITAVVGGNSDIRDVTVAFNRIDNFNRGGVFVGRDGDSTTGVSTRDIKVIGNTLVAGSRSENSSVSCILARGGDSADGSPLILGNDCKGYAITGDLFGIQAKLIGGAKILYNNLEGPFNHRSIAALDVPDLQVTGNEIEASSDGRLDLARSGGIVRDNTIKGGGTEDPFLTAEDANGLDIKGNRFIDFSNGDFSGAVVIDSTAGNTCEARVIGNKFDDSVGNFEAAIRTNSGGTLDVEIRENDVRGPTQMFSNGSDPTAIILERNRGYTTRSRGVATISSGTTSVSVSHGLALAPSGEDVIVTPRDPFGAAASFWISNIGSNTFDINLDADPTQDVQFAWQAGIES